MTADRLTLAQIATSSLASARVLEGHGLNYCSASDRTLLEVCVYQGVDVERISAELSSAHDEVPDDRDWTTAPLLELMRYLTLEHVTIQSELKLLQARLDRVVTAHNSSYPGLEHLPKVFAGLCEDL